MPDIDLTTPRKTETGARPERYSRSTSKKKFDEGHDAIDWSKGKESLGEIHPELRKKIAEGATPKIDKVESWDGVPIIEVEEK